MFKCHIYFGKEKLCIEDHFSDWDLKDGGVIRKQGEISKSDIRSINWQLRWKGALPDKYLEKSFWCFSVHIIFCSSDWILELKHFLNDSGKGMGECKLS